MTDAAKRTLHFCIVLTAAFLSFQHNTFGVASDNWFAGHPGGSEQLVLDGLLRGPDAQGRLRLGTLSPADSAPDSLPPHQPQDRKDKAGEFVPYESQYGLQLRFFHALQGIGLEDAEVLQGVAALLMSLCVGALFVLVRREFSTLAATLVAASFTFSPWVVVFARSLYWFEATWFLPLIVAMSLAGRAFRSRAISFSMHSCLLVVFLVRFLCGYEYLTTIFVASCVPIVYHGTKGGYGLKRLSTQVALCGVACLAAFLLAVGVHSRSLSDAGASGLGVIVLTAKKRLSSAAPEQVAIAVCRGDVKCEQDIANSLSSNPLNVAASYFRSADFLPYVRDLDLPQAERSALEAAYHNPGLTTVRNALKEISVKGAYLAGATLIDGRALVALLALTIFFLPKMIPAVRAMIATSLLAPLSWFLVAKGHSAIHHHLNYVLWYLPFIPFCLAALASVRTTPRPRESAT